MQDNKLILKTWKGNGNGTIIVSLPHEIATQFDLDIPSYVTVHSTRDGILIRKLKLGMNR